MIERVVATPAALAVIERLKGIHGPLMFHQSGGCCDGSAPMCYPAGEFKIGGEDVLLGRIGGCEFWIWSLTFRYFEQSQIIVDAVPGRGSGFSLESPEGVRFLTRSRVLDDAEMEALERQGPPIRGRSAEA